MRTLIAGRYEVVETLGESETSAVYKVRDRERDAICMMTAPAGKVSADADRMAAFQATVRRAREVAHDHVVQVLDLIEEGGRHYLLEEWIEGEGLDAVLKKSRALQPGEALHVARQMAEALGHAHERGLMHGALVPASIRVVAQQPPRVMVAGLATAGLGGTSMLAYTAPEWLAGGAVDARADIFGLGLILFEMLEGRPLLNGSPESIQQLLLTMGEPLLPRFSRILPSGLSALVARAIRRSPDQRQKTMAQVREEIDACLRRVGETRYAAEKAERKAKKAAAAEPVVKVRRKVAVIDNELVEAEAEAEGAAVEEAQTSRAPKPAAAKKKVAMPSPSHLGRVLVASHVRGRVVGRTMRITMLIAFVMLALGLPLFRPRHATPPAPTGHETPVAHAAPAAHVAPAAHAVAANAPEPATALGETRVEVEAAPEAPVVVAALERETFEAPKNLAPRIVGRRPYATKPVRVTEGRPVAFSVRATDRNPGDRLAYAWFVDGKQMGRSSSFRFTPPPAAVAVAHAVQVQVADARGLKAPRATWTVEVMPKMTEVNVRDWLARYTSAWQRKDVATLRLFRIVTGDPEAVALERYLDRFRGYQVVIGNESIRTDGQYASVAFDRNDYDGRGKLLGSRHETYRLEKQATGFIALQAQ
jgi:hypothetical protein